MINIPYPDETILNDFFDDIKIELLPNIRRIKTSKKQDTQKKLYTKYFIEYLLTMGITS